jgi:hypothetical protein
MLQTFISDWLIYVFQLSGLKFFFGGGSQELLNLDITGRLAEVTLEPPLPDLPHKGLW